MDTPPHGLRDRIRNAHHLLGTFVQIGDPTVLEILAAASFDFAIIDLEHGGTSHGSIGNLVRAADLTGMPLLARVNLEELARCSQLLDQGITGILVPRIGTVEQASAAVQVSRYHPNGDRGACPGIRASDYGWVEWTTYKATADEETVVGVALEGQAGFDAGPAIAAHPGIDFIFIGVFDLAQSIGYPGDVTHPEVTASLRDVVETAERNNVAVATWAPDLTVAMRWHELGVRIITVSTDVLIWRAACSQLTTDWFRQVGSKPRRAAGLTRAAYR